MEEGQFGTRKRKILKMMALKRKKLKRRYAGRGDHNERLPHLPKFLKKIGCNIMSSSWRDKAGRKYDEEFGANMPKNGNIEIQDDTMDRMEDDDLEAGPDPYKDRIIGGKKRIPAKIAKYPRNECKVCGKTFNGRSKWTLCKSCNDGTHKRCIRPGESLDNYKCQRCDPRRQEVPRARANEVNEESWSCDICEFVSLFKANLKRHMREIHKKTVTEADLILKQMQTARVQRVEAEEERVQDDVQNEERTEVQREERGGEGIQDEGTMEQILDKLGFQRFKEIFQKEEVTKEVFYCCMFRQQMEVSII